MKGYVIGLNECLKKIRDLEVNCVIMAVNIEPIKTEGGLDDLVWTVIQSCRRHRVPLVFSMNRRKLGKVTGCKFATSCLGIIKISSDKIFSQLIQWSEEMSLLWWIRKEVRKRSLPFLMREPERRDDEEIVLKKKDVTEKGYFFYKKEEQLQKREEIPQYSQLSFSELLEEYKKERQEYWTCFVTFVPTESAATLVIQNLKPFQDLNSFLVRYLVFNFSFGKTSHS